MAFVDVEELCIPKLQWIADTVALWTDGVNLEDVRESLFEEVKSEEG